MMILRGWRGRAPRQPGQVRKEAAVTSHAWVVVQPLASIHVCKFFGAGHFPCWNRLLCIRRRVPQRLPAAPSCRMALVRCVQACASLLHRDSMRAKMKFVRNEVSDTVNCTPGLPICRSRGTSAAGGNELECSVRNR